MIVMNVCVLVASNKENKISYPMGVEANVLMRKFFSIICCEKINVKL